MRKLFSRLLKRQAKPIARPPVKKKSVPAHEHALRHAERLRRDTTSLEATDDYVAVKDAAPSRERKDLSRRNEPVQQEGKANQTKVEGDDSLGRGRRAVVRQRRKSLTRGSEEPLGTAERRKSTSTIAPTMGDTNTSAKMVEKRAPVRTRKHRPKADADAQTGQTKTTDITAARLRRLGKGSLHRF